MCRRICRYCWSMLLMIVRNIGSRFWRRQKKRKVEMFSIRMSIAIWCMRNLCPLPNQLTRHLTCLHSHNINHHLHSIINKHISQHTNHHTIHIKLPHTNSLLTNHLLQAISSRSDTKISNIRHHHLRHRFDYSRIVCVIELESVYLSFFILNKKI